MTKKPASCLILPQALPPGVSPGSPWGQLQLSITAWDFSIPAYKLHNLGWEHPSSSLSLFICKMGSFILKIQASRLVLVANAGDIKDAGSIPGSGRSPRGGHGNPLQYSCLENPMDRGTWQATVHRVTKSRTWLKQLSTHAQVTRKVESSKTTRILSTQLWPI